VCHRQIPKAIVVRCSCATRHAAKDKTFIDGDAMSVRVEVGQVSLSMIVLFPTRSIIHYVTLGALMYHRSGRKIHTFPIVGRPTRRPTNLNYASRARSMHPRTQCPQQKKKDRKTPLESGVQHRIVQLRNYGNQLISWLTGTDGDYGQMSRP
jgi:hypothetical protein